MRIRKKCCSVIKSFKCILLALTGCLGVVFNSVAQVPELSPKDRDELKSRSIGLIKEFEQLLNVLANKGTTTSDVQDLVDIATMDEQGRIFYDGKVVLEDDIYALRADTGLSYDISVSISKVPEFIERGLQAALDILPSIRPYPLGHIGDGNIHFSFMGPKGMDRPTLSQYSPAITRAVNDLVTSLDGSISAEHGIGIDKLDELAHYRSRIELDTMRTIKRALDPKNIMNPGKVLRV